MYRKMDTLRAYITGDYMFIYLPEEVKIAEIPGNEIQRDTLLKQEEILAKEFEDNIPGNDSIETCLFKTLYLVHKNKASLF